MKRLLSAHTGVKKIPGNDSVYTATPRHLITPYLQQAETQARQTIRQNFDGMYLKHDIVKPLAEQYGSERIAFVLLVYSAGKESLFFVAVFIWVTAASMNSTTI